MKNTTRLTALLTAAGMIAGMAFVPMGVSAEPYPMMGDPDGNTVIDLDDAVAVLTHYSRTAAGLGGTLTDNYGITGGDTDANGKIDLDDAVNILTFYARQAAGFGWDWSIFPAYQIQDDAIAAYKTIVEKFLDETPDLTGDPDMGPRYDIVYIDNDSIPELILSPTTVHAGGGCTIYTYVDGNAICLGDSFGSLGTIKYESYDYVSGHGTGYIVSENGYTGLGWAYILYLDRGVLTEQHYLQANYTNGTFEIDGVSVTESRYNDFLDSYDCIEAGRAYSSISDCWN